MSLMIAMDQVLEVLLADGWHKVKWFDGDDGPTSSFEIDSYEFWVEKLQNGDYDMALKGGQCDGVPAHGAAWDEVEVGSRIACPLTSVLAIRRQ